MSRTIASFLVLAAIGAALLAGRDLLDALDDPMPTDAVAEVEVEASETPSTPLEEPGEDIGMDWQPIFGEVAAPQPVERARPVAAPPSFDYALKGIIVSGDIRWAILSGAGRDFLVQQGDWIEDARIAMINPRGIDIEIGDETRTISFSETAPVETAEVELPDETAEPDAVTRDPGLRRRSDAEDEAEGRRIQEVIFQGMSRQELQDILKKAEAKRRERGWVISSPD